MGQIPSNELNGFGQLVAASFFITAPLLYLLPTIEAALRKHRNLAGVALLDILLGWTVLGWIGAMIWALVNPAGAPTDAPPAEARPPAPARETKTCPFCAEEVLAAAVKCKHCGSALAI
ncbi:superinfection immunity protein [Pseudoxanthomonas winnipegensis]|uniref:Superinfection immunity protein n=2 Tax=Pseudoxanthomonas winnipegensis TaxID=2480810 RepID=A0ABY1WCN5_9GAMM|nr:superinfection immunity protein [Pseudoxanthomonas winnipegensis]